jgi:hypothetical protein
VGILPERRFGPDRRDCLDPCSGRPRVSD